MVRMYVCTLVNAKKQTKQTEQTGTVKTYQVVNVDCSYKTFPKVKTNFREMGRKCELVEDMIMSFVFCSTFFPWPFDDLRKWSGWRGGKGRGQAPFEIRLSFF